MGVVIKLLEHAGFYRLPKKAGPERPGAAPAVVKVMADYLPPADKAEGVVPVELDLTQRQMIAFLNPWRRGEGDPPQVCYATEPTPGHFVVTALMITPDVAGRLIWTALALCQDGRGLCKARGPMKGRLENRARDLIKGVGDIGGNGGWQSGHAVFSIERRLSYDEQKEFERVHGVKWQADAAARMQLQATEEAPGDA